MIAFWAVAQSQVGREPFALDRLERAGFEVYLPRIKVRDRARGIRILALFPSYLFVRIAEQWQPITKTMGVSRLLLAGDEPARLPDSALAEIKAREVKGFIRLPALAPGQKVQILRGSLQGHIAIYEVNPPATGNGFCLSSWVKPFVPKSAPAILHR